MSFPRRVVPSVERYGAEDGQITYGLPEDGRFLAISNSELETAACPHRWMLRHVRHLKTRATYAMDLGTAWDRWMGDVFSWWAMKDQPYPLSGLESCPWCQKDPGCLSCEGTGQSALRRAGRALFDTHHPEAEQMVDTLYRMAEGWLIYHHGGALGRFQVVGVHVRMAREIRAPNGNRLTFALPVVEEAVTVKTPLGLQVQGQRWRLAQPMEKHEIVRMPLYYVGEVDYLLKDRRSAIGYVLDGKSTGQIDRYADAILVDPQLPGYCWLLEAHLDRFGLQGIGGYGYDVTSSTMQRDPELLKGRVTKTDPTPASPGLSRDKRARVPSWRYERAIKAHGFSRSDYLDHLAYLQEYMDPAFYRRRDWFTSSDQQLKSSEVEIRSRAIDLMKRRLLLGRAESLEEVWSAAPRIAVCKLPGSSCPLRSPCAARSLDARTVSDPFEIGIGQTWTSTAT